MRGSVRRLWMVWLACCVAGLVVSPVVALGEGSSPEGSPSAGGTGASSLTEGSLVTSGSPAEGEQLQAQEQAKLASPEAVAERALSRSEFEGLAGAGAVSLAEQKFGI